MLFFFYLYIHFNFGSHVAYWYLTDSESKLFLFSIFNFFGLDTAHRKHGQMLISHLPAYNTIF